MSYRTRFAPSPTGPLHLGHAYSALLGHDRAHANGGTFLVRIEDLDTSRARPQWEDAIHEDLGWLGATYPLPVLRQSDRAPAYATALDALWTSGVLYPCTCKRRDIEAAVSAPQEGARMFGPDGLVYPGTCRHVPSGAMPENVAMRLNMQEALNRIDPVRWVETGEGPDGEVGAQLASAATLIEGVGDIVVRRPGMAAAYHLAVVVDDAYEGITEVVRGADLFEATQIHVVLQQLLGLPTPKYHHHALIRDDTGKRLAKRDDARAIALFRSEGRTPEDVRAMVGLPSIAA